MKKRISTLLLIVIICLSLSVPVWAGETQTPEISITWLSVDGQMILSYDRTFGWLTLYTGKDIPISENRSATVTCLVSGSTGEIINDYDFAGNLSEGLASVGKWEGNRRKCGYIDENKNEVIPLEYTWADNFSEGLACVGVGELASTKYGYINKKGEIVVRPEYDEADDFYNGVAVVAKKNEYGIYKWGLIGKTGEIIVPLEYDEIDYGEILNSGGIDGDPDRPIRVKKITSDGIEQYGYIDKHGKVLIPIVYDVAGEFVNGLACVGRKDENWELKCGYINIKGDVVIPIEYDPPGNKYTFMPYFQQDLVPIAKKDMREDKNLVYKYGYIDKNGKVVVPLMYDSAGDFTEDGFAPVGIIEGDYDNRKFGYIDETGNVVIPLEFTEVRPFCNGVAVVMNQSSDGDSKYGVINKSGEKVLPLEFDSIDISYNYTDPQKGILLAHREDGTGEVYNWSGTAILPVGTQALSANTGLIVAKQGSASGWGLFDIDGKEVLSETYDDISVRSSYIIVQRDNQYGFAENPYWEELNEDQPGSKAGIPAVPVVIGAVTVAAVVLVWLMKKRHIKSLFLSTK